VRKLGRDRITRQSANSTQSQEACGPELGSNLWCTISNLARLAPGQPSRARLRQPTAFKARPVAGASQPRGRQGAFLRRPCVSQHLKGCRRAFTRSAMRTVCDGRDVEWAVAVLEGEVELGPLVHNKLHNAELSQSLSITVNNCITWTCKLLAGLCGGSLKALKTIRLGCMTFAMRRNCHHGAVIRARTRVRVASKTEPSHTVSVRPAWTT